MISQKKLIALSKDLIFVILEEAGKPKSVKDSDERAICIKELAIGLLALIQMIESNENGKIEL